MNPSNYRVRRATVDDKPALLPLWEAMHFSTTDLEKRLTEFQLVESGEGEILGALAMEILERQGRMHSEVFADFALSGQLREKLWERMQSLAVNHGLARIWTSETAPFWKQCGFRAPDEPAMKKFPSAWVALQAANTEWLTLRLRDEEALASSLNRDFEALRREAAQQTQSAMRMARFWKFFATGLAIVVAVAVIVYCVSLLKNSPNLHPR